MPARNFATKIAFGLLIAFPIFILPSVAAAPIKAGATCSKIGTKRESSGRVFTCIKSGKKLVWDKGVPTKSALPQATPSTSPSPTNSTSATPSSTSSPSPVTILSQDPRISSITSLSNLEICKTSDQTPDYFPGNGNQVMMRNGFPRPKGSSSGAKSAKVLFIPLSFSNRPFLKTSQNSSSPLSDLDLARRAMTAVEQGFKELSAGRFEVKVDILPESEWWVFNSADPIKGGWGVDNFSEIVKVVEEKKPNFEFKDYDAFLFLLSNSYGLTSAQASFGQSVKSAKSGIANLALMAGLLTAHNTIIHEFGHALFAFEDLYLFNGSPNESGESTTPLLWDLMAGDRLTLLNWNRLLMGWLKESEVRCITNQQSSVHYVTPFGDNPQPKLVLINLTEGVTIAAEAREFGNEQRLLVYTIDTNIPHGQGPIKTFNVLLTKGKTQSVYGWDISVLDNNADGILFEVTKTDKNKYVVPEKSKQTSAPQQPDNPIKLTGGDITRKGASGAEIKWNPSNYESYRVYVTATDNFQKVYFESGFRDSNANPLTVNLTGLTCDVDLRVVSMFFTGKQGQGQSHIQEVNLKKSQC